MKKANSLIRAAMVLMLIIIIFIAMKESGIEKNTSEGTIKITGLYGITINKDDITNLELRDDIPEIKRRENGIGLGHFVRKGYFSVNEFGRARLLLHSGEGPYLIIQTEEQNMIINFRDPRKTRDEYQSLQGYLGD